MSLPKRVVLVGPMGAGKSTIGRMLAKELGYRFLDSDRIIEERCGANIPWIFDVEGEDGFRARETAMLDELSREDNTVLATGGGAYLNDETRALMREHAITVWLNADLETLWKRVQKRDTRPLLQRDDAKSVLTNLLAERTPIYSQADLVVRSKDGPHTNTVNAILKALKTWKPE